MTDDEWQYDTNDFEEPPAGDRAVEEPSDDDPQAAADDSGWRFSVDEVDEDGTVAGDEEGGWSSLHEEVEAGSPNPENVAFVAIGLLLGLVLAWQLVL
ncbi:MULTISPECIES: hypothetical protein [unclassified Halorhabdus]|uniref:DUF7312 domain-containing protein n=1 Tax=unclassified Halorhabdus TaxID=2621901 RepID=UPI0018EEF7CE|nr:MULTISPECIES: hypothetical protein [unclassified Halorhabdus]